MTTPGRIYDYGEWLERASELEEAIPEVLPEGAWNDGWDGAASAELREEPYMAYPHNWDRTFTWCQCIQLFGRQSRKHAPLVGMFDLTPDQIDRQYYVRALPYVAEYTRKVARELIRRIHATEGRMN